MNAATQMKQVTKDQFFAALYARPEDIMPSAKGPYPYTSEWRFVRTGSLFGRSVGTRSEKGGETAYYLVA